MPDGTFFEGANDSTCENCYEPEPDPGPALSFLEGLDEYTPKESPQKVSER